MKSKINIRILILLTIIAITPLVSAYTSYDSPLDYLNNEWVMFGMIFLGTFALIYFAGQKTFRENKGILSIIAGVLALFVSIALTKKAQLYSYTGEGIGDLISLIIILFLIFLFFRWIAFRTDNFNKRRFSLGGFIFGVIIALVILSYINAYDLLPDSIRYGVFGDFVGFIQGLSSTLIIILIPIAVIWMFIKFRRRKYP